MVPRAGLEPALCRVWVGRLLPVGLPGQAPGLESNQRASAFKARLPMPAEQPRNGRWSGTGESNPDRQLGRLSLYH
jgi:hypothetical protein